MANEPTLSNTKAEILKAFHEQQALLQKKSSVTLDPEKEVAGKKATATLVKAEATAEQSIEEQIAGLQKNFTSILANLSNSLTEEIKTFENLKVAISNKETELKELFDIEKEAFTLAALVNSHKDLNDKFNVDANIRRTNLQTELNDISNQIDERRKAFNTELADMKKAAEQERTRVQAEFAYDFNRQKQAQTDELNDNLTKARKNYAEDVAAQRTALAEENKQTAAREEAVTVREDKITELEDKVAQFPTILEQAKVDAEAYGRKEEAKVSAIKSSYATKDIENYKAVADGQITLLQSSLAKAEAANAELAKKLDEAYTKIQSMALASVQGSQDTKAFDKISNLIDSKNQSK